VLFGTLGRPSRSWVRPLFVTLLLGSLFAARALLLVRPVIVTLLFLALFYAELERVRRGGRSRQLLLLPVAQILWANFQGLSALGPALVAAYLVAAWLSLALRSRSRWPFASETSPNVAEPQLVRAYAGVLLACLLAMALTPFGLRALTLPATLLGRLLPGAGNVYAQVAENVPPFVLERWSGEFWHLKWFLGLLAIAFACGGRRVRLSHALVVSGLVVLALLSNRNVLLLYWLATPIAAGYLAPVARAWVLCRSRRWGQGAAFALNAGALASLLCVSAVAAAREPSLAEPTPFRMPVESARRLAALPAADVFSADHQGGYLIWQLFPRFRPYLDTRLVLRTAAEFSEYLQLADEPQRFAAFQAQHQFGYVLLPVAYPDRYLRLISTLYASPDWKLVFSNGSEVLFARRDIPTGPAWNLSEASTTARILGRIDEERARSPRLAAAQRLQLATLDIALGEFAQAESVLSSSALPEAAALRARCRLGAGDIAGARQIAERLLQRDRRDLSSLNVLARIALARGDLAAAIPLLRRALRVDPYDDEATQLLATLEETR
jgi:tetratricopeptide (TPR) repeat protein